MAKTVARILNILDNSLYNRQNFDSYSISLN